MALTSTQLEVSDYCRRADLLSPEKIEDFWERLDEEGHLSTLSHALRNFSTQSCPRCHVEGAYKVHFLGQIRHPSCNARWYLDSKVYALREFHRFFPSMERGGQRSLNEGNTRQSQSIG